MNAIKWYGSKLDSHPLTTKCITSFITFGCGDLICQTLEKKYGKLKKYDSIRFLKQASFGVIATPYFHLQFCVIIPYLFPKTAS